MPTDASNLYNWNPHSRVESRLHRLETGEVRLRHGSQSPPSGPFRRLDVDSEIDGQISVTGLLKKGSISPYVVEGRFTYVPTDTSIRWYWDGTNGSHPLLLRRSDSTIIAIPRGNLLVSALTSATTFSFLPYWSVQEHNCTIGWVLGEAGKPKVAHTTVTAEELSLQSLEDREPLSTLQATTLGSGSTTPGDPSGSGSGGGPEEPLLCVLYGTDIEVLGDWKYSTEVSPETEWVRLVAEGQWTLTCTLNHPLFTEDGGKTDAGKLHVGDGMLVKTGVAKLVAVDHLTFAGKKVKVSMAEGHLFWANGFLSHNLKFGPIQP